jgi:hypothetical protein
MELMPNQRTVKKVTSNLSKQGDKQGDKNLENINNIKILNSYDFNIFNWFVLIERFNTNVKMLNSKRFANNFTIVFNTVLISIFYVS